MTDEGKALADMAMSDYAEMMRERDAAIARAERAEAEVARLRRGPVHVCAPSPPSREDVTLAAINTEGE